jgi:hypothetical protein
MGNKRIAIPNTEAGLRAFEVIREVAEQLYEKGQRITAVHAEETEPEAETVDQYCKGGRFYRTIQTPDGLRVTIAYTYQTKEVKTLTEREARKWERHLHPLPAANATAY